MIRGKNMMQRYTNAQQFKPMHMDITWKSIWRHNNNYTIESLKVDYLGG